MPIISTQLSQKNLRQQLRRERRKLSATVKNQAACQTIRQLLPIAQRFANPHQTVKVSVYLDAFGELPTQPLIDWAYRYGFEVYLPVVTGINKPLKFVKLLQKNSRHARLINHQLGMKQPATGQKISANQLDILFMPLVAFDKNGYRMGMGGGFYDRTLAKTKAKPLKIGWAYDFQQVEALSINPWDVRLDMAVTSSKLWIFQRYLTQETHDTAKKSENKIEENTITENTETNDSLTDEQIMAVMNPERLALLLAQADAFGVVNSEQLDNF